MFAFHDGIFAGNVTWDNICSRFTTRIFASDLVLVLPESGRQGPGDPPPPTLSRFSRSTRNILNISLPVDQLPFGPARALRFALRPALAVGTYPPPRVSATSLFRLQPLISWNSVGGCTHTPRLQDLHFRLQPPISLNPAGGCTYTPGLQEPRMHELHLKPRLQDLHVSLQPLNS